MKLSLNHKVYGQGDPVIILHGLFGSLDNWATFAKNLGEDFMTYILDQRDHGKSPHTEAFNYQLLAEDLRIFMEDNWLHSASIIGHSMGGKTAMKFALENPDMVDKLIIVDMSPRAYPDRHSKVFDAMAAVDLTSLENRLDAMDVISEKLNGDKDTTAFLVKNIKREKDGSFSWKMNVDLLKKEYANIIAPMPSDLSFDGETLFIKGANSNYITEEDEDLIFDMFPQSEIYSIADAGHWVHAEQPEALQKIITEFLND